MIEDIAIGEHRQDLFDHSSVARQLAKTIKAASQSMAIGLLGPFGSGKSSVVRLLTKELANNRRWAVLHVSAEHHSGVARARALMYALIDEAHQQKLIDDNDYLSHRACLEGSRQHTLPRPHPRTGMVGSAGVGRYVRAGITGLGWVGAMLATLWLIGAAAVFVAHQVGIGAGVPSLSWFASHGASPLTTVLVSGAAISAVLAAGKEGALQRLKAYEITVTTPRPDSTDELEQAFTRLLNGIDRRLVIAVDDIDRLAATDVLEALTTVRSLLLTGHQRDKGPVFVLSCDESIVREAIIGVRPGLAHRPAELHPGQATTSDAHTSTEPAATKTAARKATEEAAQEYLNKLFTVRLVLPAPGDADLRDYAAELLLDGKSPHPVVAELGGEGEVRTLLDVLIHQDVRDPRHVIRLLNSFFTDYQLAQSRECSVGVRPARIAQGEVTGFPITLARLTVLRHDFRAMYDAIRAEEDLLHLLDDALLGTRQNLDEPPLRAYADKDNAERLDLRRYPGLRYLLATAARARLHRPASISPLLTLGSSPASRLLGSEMAAEIQQELIGRNGGSFARRLAAPLTRARVLEAAAAALDAARPGQDLDNALSAAITALGEVADLFDDGSPEETRALRILTDGIARHRTQMTLHLPSHILVPLIRLTDSAHLPRLIATLREQPQDAGEAMHWAAALLEMPTAPHTEELALGLAPYFTYLAEAGDEEDLSFWTNDEQSKHQGAWPASAFAALLTLAVRSDNAKALQQAGTATIQHADIHRWNRTVALALLTCLQGDQSARREGVRVLSHSSGPDEQWEASRNSDTYETLAGQLTAAVAQACSEDDDVDSVLATFALFSQWLPGISSLTEHTEATRAIAEAIVAVAGEHPQIASATGDVLCTLPPDDAARCMTELAKNLSEYRDSSSAITIALRDVLTDYLHRVTNTSAQSAHDAAEACVSALTDDLTALDAAGRFARKTLPMVMTTPAGRRRAPDLAAKLISSIPPNQPSIAEELLPSLHVVLHDDTTRNTHLPHLNQLVQQLVSHGQPVLALTFTTRYIAEPAIDVNCLHWYASHWMSLTPDTRDQACDAAQRTDLPIELRDRLVQHLVETTSDKPWEHADALWEAATAEQQSSLLAHAQGRAPDLAARAAEADTDVLVAALSKAGQHLDDVLQLMTAAIHGNDAITTYVRGQLSLEPWTPNLCNMAIAASTDPQQLWTLVEEHLGEDQTDARRAAEIAGYLIVHHPKAMPANLVQLLADPLREADEPLAEAIGHALHGQPKLATKVRNAMAGQSAAPHQRRRNSAFMKASGLS
ncbi:P-loop NTPase fold protein [Streptomyces sp. NPDC058385]|uniref:P-loop NTPase fold protein n=1 Tax=Streptomyces sp. NPDC058385 TaxID=3346473 RepID=UPI003660036A